MTFYKHKPVDEAADSAGPSLPEVALVFKITNRVPTHRANFRGRVCVEVVRTLN